MKTFKLLVDCTTLNTKPKQLGANFEPVLSVEIDVDATEIPEILDIIGIKKIVEHLKDELLDDIGREYVLKYFDFYACCKNCGTETDGYRDEIA